MLRFLSAATIIVLMVLYARVEGLLSTDQLPLQLNDTQKQWLNEAGVIKVGVMSDWPPINYINLKDEQDGFGPELANLLNQKLGGRIQLVSGDWQNLYAAVKEGELDAIMDITPRPERMEDFLFTEPYLNIPHVIIARKDGGAFPNKESLVGHTIALEAGFGSIAYFDKNFPNIHINTYENTSQALTAVIAGNADAYVGNRAVANYVIRTELMSSLQITGRAEKRGSILSIGVNKKDTVLRDILQLALDDISNMEVHAALEQVIADQESLFVDLDFTPAELAWMEAHPKIRLASDPAWPPFEYIDENNQYKGIAADFMGLIEEKLPIEFIDSPNTTWRDVVEKLKNKQLDVFSLAMETQARKQFAVFTEPYVSNAMVILTRNDVDFIPGPEGLYGKKVAVEYGYASYDLISRMFPSIELKTYRNTEAALIGLLQGEVFAYVGNLATTSHIMQKQGITGISVSGEMPLRFELAMGVRDDWPELVSILNKTLASITPQEKAHIFKKWINVSAPKSAPYPIKWLFISILVLGLVVLIVIYWNLQLNRKVKERTQLLQHQANHDALTGLPNRSALLAQLEDRLNIAERQKKRLVLLFIDLDDFKKINDTLGHSTGDALLQAATVRLKSVLRKSDIISRFGGDEFVIAVDYIENDIDIETVCLQLLDTMKGSYNIEGRNLSVSMSIGVAIYPEDGKDVEALLQNADTAMYSSKSLGGDHFRFYSSQMNMQIRRRMEIEQALYQSVKNNEVFLNFQPVIDLETNKAKKLEVLCRWNHPEMGMISPAEFIPVAEHTGYILELGDFIMDNALAACKRLQEKYEINFCVAVNVSPRQLREPGFVDRCSELLKQHELAPTSLVLEITEGVLLKQQEYAQEVLLALAKVGVRLAMDDFGTGYSSLSYIRKYPFDVLKIDQEFVQDIPHDQSSGELIESIVAMANSMRIEVVAEGVETQEQHEYLKSKSCHKGQGYFYARPMVEQDLHDWLDQH